MPHILRKGPDWYKGLSLSNPKSTGTKLFSVCGHVAKPGNSSRINMPDYFYIFTPMGSDMNLDWTVEIP